MYKNYSFNEKVKHLYCLNKTRVGDILSISIPEIHHNIYFPVISFTAESSFFLLRPEIFGMDDIQPLKKLIKKVKVPDVINIPTVSSNFYIDKNIQVRESHYIGLIKFYLNRWKNKSFSKEKILVCNPQFVTINHILKFSSSALPPDAFKASTNKFLVFPS